MFTKPLFLFCPCSTYRSVSWNVRAGLDYFVSPNTTLGILLSGNIRPRTDRFNYSGEQNNAPMQPDMLSRGSTNDNYHWKSRGANLNFQHKLNSDWQKLTADLDEIRNQRRQCLPAAQTGKVELVLSNFNGKNRALLSFQDQQSERILL